jgi:hypothetical protein
MFRSLVTRFNSASSLRISFFSADWLVGFLALLTR